MTAYKEALERRPVLKKRIQIEATGQKKSAIEMALVKAMQRARKRAEIKGFDFDLTREWLFERLRASNCRCEVTNIPFQTKTDTDAYRCPYSLSIDRIDNARGYTKDNVRLVLVALNIMLSEWGEEVFSHVAACYRQNKSRTFYSLQAAKCGTEGEKGPQNQ